MKKLIQLADRILVRYTPDPFVIAIILTWLTIGLAVWLTGSGFTGVVRQWGDGFWDLADFTLHMAMILLGGFVVATSPPVQWVLRQMVALLQTPWQGVLFCTLAAMLASWVNWGLGLVVGGLVAVETARRLPDASFRVLVAAAYSGFLVWHGGLSGSIPLAVNTPDNFSLTWVQGQTIPLSQTLFGTVNLVALAAMLLLLPVINLLLLRMTRDETGMAPSLPPPPDTAASTDAATVSGEQPLLLDRSIWMALALVALAVIYLQILQSNHEFSLNLDSLNLVLFMTGLILHGSPRNFSRAVSEAIPKIAPILIQYPLYAAIMAVLRESGLASQIAEWFVSHSSATTFPLMTFYSAGLINLFVPSGGGQWGVQAPIVLPAAQALGADIPKTVMAVAWGDAWTNMAQPFWAVPLLAIAGLRIRDVIGLSLVTLIASGIVLSLVFLLVA